MVSLMKDPDTRRLARELANSYLAQGDALGWFEPFYRASGGEASTIPWADLRPNPHLRDWLRGQPPGESGRACLVVGCGLGDDAEALATAGFETTAFDIAPTAIDWCRRRFAGSKVDYVAADLFEPRPSWLGKFDLVVEVYTLQVLPEALRGQAIVCLASCLAPRGVLLVICRAREKGEDRGEMPWPLTRAECESFCSAAELCLQSVDEFVDPYEEDVRRIRAVYQLQRDTR